MERNKPRALLSLAAVFFCLVTATAYYKQNGLKDLARLRAAIGQANGEMRAIRAENDRIRQELASLNYSDEYVEAIARDSLGLVRPGEVVYEFIDAETLQGPGR